MNISDIQRQLKNAGFNPGGIDGGWGPLTQAAVDSCMRTRGDDPPPWLIVAERELGVHEIAGPKNNQRIIEYHRHTSLKASADEVPWCSAFANFCMNQAGIKGTNSAAAISWATWGRKLIKFKYGCVCVFSRTGGNHVTFGVWEDPGSGDLYCLGGNQSDSVCVSRQARSRLLGFRWTVA